MHLAESSFPHGGHVALAVATMHAKGPAWGCCWGTVKLSLGALDALPPEVQLSPLA